jgi:hypothetical protein
LLTAALCGLASAPLVAQNAPEAAAGVVGEIRAEHRAGQTFVTWRELSGSGKRYRVYRAARPLASALDLAAADYLGEVDDKSSRNQGRSLATGSEHNWILADGAAPLASDQGLFVHTVEGPPVGLRARARTLEPERAFYAVTVVTNGVEERALTPGSNTTVAGAFEWPAPPRPVLQSTSDGFLWGHWVGDRDTPFQPALSPWPSRGYNFLLSPGSAPGRHGLALALHAAGQTYADAWPQRFEVPNDVDLLKVSDLVPYTSWTFWFGAHEALPAAPGPNAEVWNFTQLRILHTLDLAAELRGDGYDPERVYVMGGSMGAIGGMYLVQEAPERFAAALLRNGLYDLTATDYRNPGAFERVFGSLARPLVTRDGLSILDRTNASFMAAREPARDWPLIRTLNGRNDETVGWMSAVGLMHGLAAAGRPAVHYFDERTHNPNGYWRNLERALIARTCQVRRDRPSLRFDACSLDDDAGDGARDSGDPVGTLNGAVDYDAESAHAEAMRLEFEVYLRAAGVLDDAPGPRASVRLTPHRTGAFRPEPDEAVQFTLRDQGELVDEHLLFADEYGRVRTPAILLERARRAASFERGTPATRAALFLGAAPRAGEGAQCVLRGTPGAVWSLYLRLSFPRGGDAQHFLTGRFDARGLADLTLPLPRATPAGTRLAARSFVDGRLSPPAEVEVQGALAPFAPQSRQR